MPHALPRLIALSSGELRPGDESTFVEGVARAFTAGLPAILLREPALPDRDYLRLAERLVELCASAGERWLALHDRAHLAAALPVDALHLSFRSLRPSAVRAWLPARVTLGLSTHAADDPELWAGADYLFHGPYAPTPKGRFAPPVGLEGMRAAVEKARAPLLALGGVTPADVPALLAAGAHGVAVRAGILAARDPARATRAYLEAFP